MPKITIAKREYDLSELPALDNSEWRQSLTEQYGTLIQQLMSATDTQYDTPDGLAKLGNLGGALVVKLGGSIEDLRDRVIAYSPDLQRDRDYILKNGYDSEFLKAFVEVIKLAYPFGGLSQMMTAALRQLGELSRQTSRNSR